MNQKTKITLFLKPKKDPMAYRGNDVFLEVHVGEQLYCSFGTSTKRSVEDQSSLIVKNLRLVHVEVIHSVKNETDLENLPKLKDIRKAFKS